MRAASVTVVLVLLAAACSGSGDESVISAEPTAIPTDVEATASPASPQPTQPPPPSPSPEPTASPEPVPGVPIDGGVESWFTPRLETRPCSALGPGEIACYSLHVAADRDDPTGGIIVLPILEAIVAGADRSDAVVTPAGGPGFSGLRRPNLEALTVNRNAVSYDQRGTGGAKPSLECDASDDAFVRSLQTTEAYEVERTTMRTARAACITTFEAEGIDLTDYNSIASAHDLEDIRVALGYDQWDLVGISYGGRLALTYMREHPSSVRAVILDSVYDVSYGGLADSLAATDRAFAALAEACAASEPCAARGDLSEMIERVRLRYNESPIAFNLPFDNQPVDFLLTGNDVIAGLFTAMYITDLLPALPAMISQLDQGETGVVRQFVLIGLAQATDQADIMAYATNCSDNANLDAEARDLEAMAAVGRYTTVASGYEVCPADWPATSPDYNEPVVSDVPALIVAGGLDPITPPGPTAALSEHLPNSTYLLYPAGGHGVSVAGGCMESIVTAFVAAPTEPLDVSCSETEFLPLVPQ